MKLISLVLVLALAAMGCATAPRPPLSPTAEPPDPFADMPVRQWDEATQPWVPVESTASPTPSTFAAKDLPPVPASTSQATVTPPAQEGPSAAQIIGTILLLPLVIPVLALAAVAAGPGSGYWGVSCKGKVYADGTKWRSSCY